MGDGVEEGEANLTLVASKLVHAGNPDFLAEKIKAKHGTEEVPDEERKAIYEPLADEAIKPFHNPDLRDLLEILRRDTDQFVDDSADELIDAGYDEEKAQGLIQRYELFITDHKDELDAIQLIYTKPYNQRHLSYQQIEELADEIKQPPYNIAPLEVWKAYEQLEKNKVKGVPAKELLTNIVSLIRFSTGLSDVLEPFPELVNQRFESWIQQQLQPRHSREQGESRSERGQPGLGGNPVFTEEQQQWLHRIKEQIANNAEFEMDDFEFIPACKEEGGLLKAQQLFGKELNTIVQELNGYLIA